MRVVQLSLAIVAAVALSVGAGCNTGSRSTGNQGTPGPTPSPTATPTPTPPPGGTINGTPGDDVLTGTSAGETINGLDGDDIIEGGDGGDIIDGGNGEDTASYAGSPAAVTVDLNAGTATGGHATGDMLSNIENLIGSAFADTLTGDANDNVLEGGGGGDTIDGGGGTDVASYESSPAAVTVNLLSGMHSGGDAAGDMLTSIEDLRGSAFADTLTGDATFNQIEGGPGADVIDGGSGPPELDAVTFEHSPAAVTVNLATGTGMGGDAQGDTYTNIEFVRGSDFDDTLTGSDAARSFMIGGEGADTLIGSPVQGGAITYVISPAAVMIDLTANTASGGHAAGDNVSDANLDFIVGSPFDDVLVGSNDINTTIDGGAGNDTITGGAFPAAGTEFNNLDGGPGADTVTGSTEFDIITYDPADVAYDFVSSASNFLDILFTTVDLDLGNPGPTIVNMGCIWVPAAGTGTPITVTLTPADVAASAVGGLLFIDAIGQTNMSDAAIMGTGWTSTGTQMLGMLTYRTYTGAAGTQLFVNTLITQAAGGL